MSRPLVAALAFELTFAFADLGAADFFAEALFGFAGADFLIEPVLAVDDFAAVGFFAAGFLVALALFGFEAADFFAGFAFALAFGFALAAFFGVVLTFALAGAFFGFDAAGFGLSAFGALGAAVELGFASAGFDALGSELGLGFDSAGLFSAGFEVVSFGVLLASLELLDCPAPSAALVSSAI